MKKLLYCIVFFTSSCLAQTSMKSVSGTIQDTHTEGVVGAAVKLFQAKDSVFVKGVVADEQGKFKIENLKTGTYYLKVSSIAFKEFMGIGFDIKETTKDVELPTIFLLPAKETTLKEVVITAKKPLIEQEIDRTIVNVEAMLSAATSNTLEVLERTPGVQIDAQGTITLNGRSGVLVLIDGRSTYMSGQDLAAYLKSLPGGMLQKLELMDNPPAKYEAAGGSVINIILKKNRNLGLTGNVSGSYSQGQKARSNNAVNLNFNRQKFNFFTNLGYNIDGNAIKETNERTIFTEQKTILSDFNAVNNADYSSKSLFSRVGLDINASPKTVFGFQVFFQNRPRHEQANFQNNILKVSEPLPQHFTGANAGDFNWQSKGANFNFNHKLNDKGRELSGDLNYINYASDGLRFFENFEQNLAFQKFDNRLINDINIYNFKADYSHPIAKTAKFEAGIKASYIKNDNDVQFNQFTNNQYSIDYNKSNHFIYTENINAAYVSFQKNINKKLSTQLGVRAENTYLLGELLANQQISGERFTQNFKNVFPSVFINYKLDSSLNHTIGLNYTRRINRPNYHQFNPFLTYIDVYTYTQGNTELHPFFLHIIQLRYQYKQFYTLSLGYDGADGILDDITIRRGETFIKKPFNVGTGFRVGLSQNFNLKLTKFWSSNMNIQIARFQIDGNADGFIGTSRFYTFRTFINNQFNFGKGWSGELTGFISTAERFYPIADLGKASFNATIQKKILKDKGALRLSFDDPTYTNFTRERTADFQNTYQFRKSVYDTRRVGLAFSYRFGNEKYARKRKHQDNAAQEEQRRVE